MRFELKMSTDLHLAEAIKRLQLQGIDAKPGTTGLVLVIAGVEAAQEAPIRGYVLQIDPNAVRVLPPGH
jgi:hypothetical protein